MKNITSIDALIPLSTLALKKGDFWQNLKQEGYELSAELEKKLTPPANFKPLMDSEQQEALRKKLEKTKNISFSLGKKKAVQAAAKMPEGEYDLYTAIRFSVINEVLNAYFDYDGIPDLTPEQTDKIFSALSDDFGDPVELFRNFFTNIPLGAEIGEMEITGPIQLTPVNKTNKVIAYIPFKLQFLESSTPQNGAIDAGIHELAGTWEMGLTLHGETNALGDKVVLYLYLNGYPKTTLPRNPAERLKLIVAPDSKIQPKSKAALEDFPKSIELELRKKIDLFINILNRIEIGQQLPFISTRDLLGGNATIDLVNYSADGGVCILGLRLSDTTLSDDSLLSNPFFSDTAPNVFARVNESYLNKFGNTPSFLAFVNEKIKEGAYEFVRIDGLAFTLNPDEIKVKADVRLNNFCYFLYDVDFTVTQTYKFTVLANGKIQIEVSTDIDYASLAEDILICLPQLILIAAALGPLLSDVLAIIGLVKLNSKLSDSTLFVNSMISPNKTLPSTELVPQIEVLQGHIFKGYILSFGLMSFIPDTKNYYFYLNFFKPSLLSPLKGTPIPKAKISMINKNDRNITGDDVQYKEEFAEKIIAQTPKFKTEASAEYVPKIADNILASGTTNDEGKIRFVLPSISRSNLFTTTKTTSYTDPSREDKITETQLPTIEQKPDIFFEVIIFDEAGKVIEAFDTLSLPNGFIKNFSAKKLGQARLPFKVGIYDPVVHT